MNTLSRNTPIALVVGAAGFIGSHLSEKLVSKKIQVVGVDNLSTGSLDNLKEAAKDNLFHFCKQGIADNLTINLPRLDYAFFLISENLPQPEYQKCLEAFLGVCQEFKPKILLVSSILLYDEKLKGKSNLREAEKTLAAFAKEKKINARIVRLSAVFGPRMRFINDDPLERLIIASVKENIRQTETQLDFTSRSLFVLDSVDLLIKAVMHSGTLWQIYDGAPVSPVKVSEIRQILLDPLWHEKNHFQPTPLPPWPSTNLLKTEKELSWGASTPLVKALRLTLAYFKERPDLAVSSESAFGSEAIAQARRGVGRQETDAEIVTEHPDPTLRQTVPITPNLQSHDWRKEFNISEKASLFTKKLEWGIIFIICFGLISFGLLWPLAKYSLDLYRVGSSFQKSQTQESLNQTDKTIAKTSKLLNSLENFVFIPKLQEQVLSLKDLVLGISQLTKAETDQSLGSSNLLKAVGEMTGENQVKSGNLFARSLQDYSSAQTELELAKTYFGNQKLLNLAELQATVAEKTQTVSLAKALAFSLEHITSQKTPQTYLLVLLDNQRLKISGGPVLALATLKFEKGKLTKIESVLLTNLEQFGSVNEPDYSANAKAWQGAFQKITRKNPDGVIALDMTTFGKLLELNSQLLTSDGQAFDIKKFDRAVEQKDQAKLGTILAEAVKELFYLPKLDWSKLSLLFANSLTEKHLLLYFNDQMLESFYQGQDWSGLFPKGLTQAGERSQFISLLEESLSKERLSLEVKRSFRLETWLDSMARLKHRLTVTLKAPEGVIYFSNLQIYLKSGQEITSASFAESDIQKELKSFSDYGLAGYNLRLKIAGKDGQKLVLEYQDLKPLDLTKGQVSYQQTFLKQIGTGPIPLEFIFNYPPDLRAVGPKTSSQPVNQLIYSTDLSEDRVWKINLLK